MRINNHFTRHFIERGVRSARLRRRTNRSPACAWCSTLIGILMISTACEIPVSDFDASPSDNFGYANATFRYFYDPEDQKIYYVSGNAVHRMDVNGRNSAVIRSNLFENLKNPSALFPFIYVSNGTVYYNDKSGNTTYRMNTDGTEHAVAQRGKSGPMGTYGTGERAVLYFDDRTQYLRNTTRYFSTGAFNLSKQTPPGSGEVTALTNKQADNFVLAPDGIYFRLRPTDDAAHGYRIMKVGYDVTPRGAGDAARLNDADMQSVVDPGADGTHRASEPNVWVVAGGQRFALYRFNTLNVSRDFIAYIGRSIDHTSAGILTGGLNVVSRATDGNRLPRTVLPGLNKFDLAGGGINIIGDYVYWLTDDKTNERYKLYRVRKDGTGYGQVRNIPY